MAIPPERPLLSLSAPSVIPRKKGPPFFGARKLTPSDQAGTKAGQKLIELAKLIDANEPLLQLKTDPSALAPERLLVFELTGGVMKFHEAVRLIEGLEFLGAEDIEEDEFDKTPTLYLMVPSEGALNRPGIAGGRFG